MPSLLTEQSRNARIRAFRIEKAQTENKLGRDLTADEREKLERKHGLSKPDNKFKDREIKGRTFLVT